MPNGGITIELSPQAVQELQERRGSRSRKDRSKGLDVIGPVAVVSEQEDWNYCLPQSNTGSLREDSRVVDRSDGDDDDDAAATDEASFESALSYGQPPPTLPLVLVDVERLVGYAPSNAEEASLLKTTVRQALWGDEEDNNWWTNDGDGADETKDEPALVLARDFEERVTELFASGMARHTDTGMHRSSYDKNPTNIEGDEEVVTTITNGISERFLAVEYPEYLCRDGKVHSTMRTWKKVLQPHPVPVVNRLLTQWLAHCSRSLLYKHDLRIEVERLCESEHAAWERLMQEEEWLDWKTTRRSEQLQHLYEVRETLQERVGQATDTQRRLEHSRQERVQAQLRQKREGLQVFDLSSPVFAFGDDVEDEYGMRMFGKEDDDSFDNSQPLGSDTESHNTYYDGNEESVTNDKDTIDDDSHVLLLSDLKPKEPIQGRTNNNITEGDHENVKYYSNKESETNSTDQYKSKLQAAKLEEQNILEQCTSKELLVATAVADSLSKKLQQVDDLLESLQEEQWADEEDDERGPYTKSVARRNVLSSDGSHFSLLDQILAMILGASPPPHGVDLKDHVGTLEREHQSFLEEWETYYGRLPPYAVGPLASTRGNGQTDRTFSSHVETHKFPAAQKPTVQNSESLKASLGIVDNDQGLWDDSDEDGVSQDEEEAEACIQSERKFVTGFRPGGRV